MRVAVQALVLSVISSMAFAGGYPYAPAALNDAKSPWRDKIDADYTTVLNGFSQALFATPATATEFRIRLKCRPKRSAGIVEIRTR